MCVFVYLLCDASCLCACVVIWAGILLGISLGAKSEKMPILRSCSTDCTRRVLWLFMKNKGCSKLFVVVILRKSVQSEGTSEVFVHGTLVCVTIAMTGRSVHQAYSIWTSWYISFPFLSFWHHSSWELVSLEGICGFVLPHGALTDKYLSCVWVVFWAAAEVAVPCTEPEVWFLIRSFKTASLGRWRSDRGATVGWSSGLLVVRVIQQRQLYTTPLS